MAVRCARRSRVAYASSSRAERTGALALADAARPLRFSVWLRQIVHRSTPAGSRASRIDPQSSRFDSLRAALRAAARGHFVSPRVGSRSWGLSGHRRVESMGHRLASRRSSGRKIPQPDDPGQGARLTRGHRHAGQSCPAVGSVSARRIETQVDEPPSQDTRRCRRGHPTVYSEPSRNTSPATREPNADGRAQRTRSPAIGLRRRGRMGSPPPPHMTLGGIRLDSLPPGVPKAANSAAYPSVKERPARCRAGDGVMTRAGSVGGSSVPGRT
jgi:hypothetical protein